MGRAGWADCSDRSSAHPLSLIPHPASMNAFILLVTALCFVYLVYAMLRPERF